MGFDAIDLRRALSTGLQEGVIDAGSYKVTERSEGSNMSVDVAAQTGEGAWVKGDSVTAQGLYYIAPHTAKINESIAAANATNPRIDQVVLELLDDTHDSSGNNKARVRVLTGTATSGATLDNRTGAAALPASAIRLADVLVAAGATSIVNASIRDRRPWARGAYWRVTRTSNASSTNDYTTALTTFASIDGTNLKPRIECSGVPLRLSFAGRLSHGTVGATLALVPWQDGAVPEHTSGNWFPFIRDTNAADLAVTWSYEWTPTTGSHTIEWAWLVSAGTGTILARAANPVRITVEELVRQNASNS